MRWLLTNIKREHSLYMLNCRLSNEIRVPPHYDVMRSTKHRWSVSQLILYLLSVKDSAEEHAATTASSISHARCVCPSHHKIGFRTWSRKQDEHIQWLHSLSKSNINNDRLLSYSLIVYKCQQTFIYRLSCSSNLLTNRNKLSFTTHITVSDWYHRLITRVLSSSRKWIHTYGDWFPTTSDNVLVRIRIIQYRIIMSLEFRNLMHFVSISKHSVKRFSFWNILHIIVSPMLYIWREPIDKSDGQLLSCLHSFCLFS